MSMQLFRIYFTRLLWALGLLAVLSPAQAQFDHRHQAFDAVLKKHVAWNSAGTASTVSYKGLQDSHAELKKVLDAYSAVSKSQYDGFKRDEKLAFLINAYNAFTLELILSKYPNLKSIKDIGSVFQAPWKQKFFRLLGEEKHLDNVEHDMIRAPGVFDEPRIHFAVVCASVGCPALRPEAFTAERMEALLEDGARRFLRDRSRNRFNPATGKLEISKIFDWYKGDFEKGLKGITSREVFFGKYADLLAAKDQDQAIVKEGKAGLVFLEYDWSLNDRR
jgi:Protein of unknown function, DUF547